MKNNILNTQELTPVYKIGFYSAILTTLLTVITFGIAIFTPPFSGPFCATNCFMYPYLDIASRFPRDYIWMYPAMLLQISLIALFTSLHHVIPKQKKIFGSLGLIFVILSAFTLLIDYFTQVSVIQPSLLLGETDGISLFTQFNPHGLFIVFEELGFILFSFGLLFFGMSLDLNKKLQKIISLIFKANFILNLLSFILITLSYGIFREYRFEVATISLNWLTTIISGILLTRLFKDEQ